MKRPTTVFLVFVLLAAMCSASLLWQRKVAVTEARVDELENIVGITELAIHRWKMRRLDWLEHIGRQPRLLRLTRELLAAKSDDEPRLKDKSELSRIREYMNTLVWRDSDLGFFIIGPDHTTIAASDNGSLGEKSPLADLDPHALRMAFEGRAKMLTPEWVRRGRQKILNAYFLAPIMDEENTVVAVLAYQVNPFEEMSAIVRMGGLGKSGETYLVDKRGQFLSGVRFVHQLGGIGSIVDTELEGIRLEVRDPGVNLLKGERIKGPIEQRPFTYLAQKIIEGESGRQSASYKDYRGVSVLGAWSWDKSMGFGIAAEIEESEALESFYINAWTTVGIVAFFAILGFFVAMYLEYSHQKIRKGLLAAKLAAEKANLMKDRFVALVAHDLKEPLAVIKGFVDLLNSEKLDPKDSRRFLTRISGSCELMRHKINDLLEAERTRLNQIESDLKLCDLRATTEKVFAQFAEKCESKRLNMVNQISPKLRVCTDPDLALKVLTNIISNAVKFSHPGGTITVDAVVSENTELVVRDTGIGMNEHTLEHLFEAGQTLSREGTFGEQGSGLGLLICKDIMVSLGGDIKVESEVNKGSTFRLIFPGTLRAETSIEEAVRSTAV